MNTNQIKLQPELEKAILDLGFSEFTEIQEKVIPLIQQGNDVIGQSYTGSGKTLAFGFPTLEKVNRGQGIQLLIVIPTRELCNQVAREMRKFSKYKPLNTVEVYGGVSISPQIDALKKADIVIGTPGRLLDHLNRRTINLSAVNMLVLDEADKMFDMGFIDDVKKIISHLPKQRQTMLFSATISHDVISIANHYMNNPVKVKVQTYLAKEQIIQHYYNVDSKDKFSLLVNILKQEKSGLVMVFCATRRMVDGLGSNLVKQGIKAQALHGGLSQNRRKQVMDSFHGNKLDVLIASDVAARGVDIKNVNLIINYDIPKTAKEYIHRIGRTARAGSKGKVISLLTNQDYDNFRRVLEDRSLSVQKMEVPKFEHVFYVSRISKPYSDRANKPRGRFHHSRSDRPKGRFHHSKNTHFKKRYNL